MAARSTMAGIPLSKRRPGEPIHLEKVKVNEDTQGSRNKEAMTLRVMVEVMMEVELFEVRLLTMRHSREVLKQNSGR